MPAFLYFRLPRYFLVITMLRSRYIVESYPTVIAASGVTCASLWRHSISDLVERGRLAKEDSGERLGY